jgi:hypothetical protein
MVWGIINYGAVADSRQDQHREPETFGSAAVVATQFAEAKILHHLANFGICSHGTGSYFWYSNFFNG